MNISYIDIDKIFCLGELMPVEVTVRKTYENYTWEDVYKANNLLAPEEHAKQVLKRRLTTHEFDDNFLERICPKNINDNLNRRMGKTTWLLANLVADTLNGSIGIYNAKYTAEINSAKKQFDEMLINTLEMYPPNTNGYLNQPPKFIASGNIVCETCSFRYKKLYTDIPEHEAIAFCK